ncbi:SGNH/GDSL hydrolase family protein [Frankia sp. AgB32]|uniref:SGNH/GDSL hydrolase family protein n=1 Tax=Frankia sp. AgB32 TaxID=631119 RepID=UPI00200D673D|nr:SGNH/GDSL hydrolase family protein [Frankia sp. AgB32]MCK9895190.1 SGNH/GDSL hydrolase family protein [Frankia sp. AgB32]
MRSRPCWRLVVAALVAAVLAAGCGSGGGGGARPTAAAGPTGAQSQPVVGTPPDSGSSRVTGGRYVAMGSSFAAGPGIGRDIGAGCGRSARNYPHLVAQRLGFALTDVTCSGATTTNLLTTPQRGHPPQVDAVTPDTRLVTITVGGNDLGYSAATAECAGATAAGRSCAALLPSPAATAAAAVRLRGNLTRLLRAIDTAAPGVLVYLVSYPRIFPDPPVTCPDNVISTADTRTLAGMGGTLEQTLRQVATERGIPLVDAYAASAGRDVCAAANVRWVEGSHTSGVHYHPNADGMAAVSRLIENALAGAGRIEHRTPQATATRG